MKTCFYSDYNMSVLLLQGQDPIDLEDFLRAIEECRLLEKLILCHPFPCIAFDSVVRQCESHRNLRELALISGENRRVSIFISTVSLYPSSGAYLGGGSMSRDPHPWLFFANSQIRSWLEGEKGWGGGRVRKSQVNDGQPSLEFEISLDMHLPKL